MAEQNTSKTQSSEASSSPLFVQYHSEQGKKVLYEPTKRVLDVKSCEIQNLISDMKTKMQGFGVGLAANQVGRALQLFMIEYSPAPESPAHTARYTIVLPPVPYQVFLNPKIVEVSEERMGFWHGCLSAMGHDRGRVATYKWLKYEALNENGEKISGVLDEFGAVVFQHEFRHLLGSLYLDHAKTFRPQDELSSLFQSGELSPFEEVDDSTPLLLSDYQVGDTIERYHEKLAQ